MKALLIALIGMTLNSSASEPTAKTLYEIPLKTLAGLSTDLKAYQGKVLLIVNTASECGYTPQYKGLQALFEKYGSQGFYVLGFPSNDFGAQEPGTSDEIQNFCDRKFHVKFPLFEKNSVTGNRRQPLYSYLIENGPSKNAVGWNFEKFLVGRDGKIISRFPSKITPESTEIISAIETALKNKK